MFSTLALAAGAVVFFDVEWPEMLGHLLICVVGAAALGAVAFVFAWVVERLRRHGG